MWINHKVENGKFFRIYIEGKEVVEKIKITGDFFFYPETGILEIEKHLIGKKVSEIGKEFDKFIQEKGYEALGFSGKDIDEAIRKWIIKN